MPFNTESFSKSLTEKLGPLPGYVWVGLGVGAIYLYRRSHPSTAKVISLNPAAPIDTSSTPASASSSGGSSAPMTNADWANQAAQSLYGSSAYSPEDINAAISAYLSGATPTAKDQGIINAATAGLGNLPAPIGPQVDYLPYIFAPAPLTPPDITPGYNNPPGFSAPAANDGPSATAVAIPTIPVYSSPTYSPYYPPTAPVGAPVDSSTFVPRTTPYSYPQGPLAPTAPTAPTVVGAGSGNSRVS